MASLPLVNQQPQQINVGGNIIKSLQQRLNFSTLAKTISSSRTKQVEDKFATKSQDSTSVLNKLYNFFVKDTFKQNLYEEEQLKEQQEESDSNELIQNTLIQEQEIPDKKVEKEPEEGFFGKMFRYLKYFSTGKMIYKNWDTISKFLGLEGLTKTIRSISDEFGVSKIIEDMKNTIGSIMEGFGLGDISVGRGTTAAPSQLTGPKSINAADPKMVRQAMKFFMGKGLTIEQAAGMVGNMLQENPAFALDIGGDHGKAGGLFQWQGERQKGMGTTFEAQMQHAWDEMTGKSPIRDIGSERALSDLKKSTSVEESARAVQGTAPGRGLTRAGTPMIENRIRYAKGAMELMQTPESPSISTDLKGDNSSAAPATTFSTSNIPTQKHERIVNREFAEPGETGGDIEVSKVTGKNIASKSDLDGLKFIKHSHGRDAEITPEQAKKVQQLRSALGQSEFIITSGFRPKDYNDELSKKMKGVAKNSFHTHGMACDISIPKGYDIEKIADFVRTASRIGFGGIGVYLGPRFIHVDIGPVRIWHHGLPKPIQQALDDHAKGRVGKQTTRDIPNVEHAEPGEISQSPENIKLEQQQENQDPLARLDFLGDALQSYVGQVGLFSKILGGNVGQQTMARLEEMMTQQTGEIPRKDALLPDLRTLFNSDSVMINNINNNEIISNFISNKDADTPSIFLSAFNYSNYNG